MSSVRTLVFAVLGANAGAWAAGCTQVHWLGEVENGADGAESSGIDTGTGTDSSSETSDGIGCDGIPCPIGEGACPAQCTSCAGGVCKIQCLNGGDCNEQSLNCPPGWPCDVACDGSGACQGTTVNCADGDCSISCGNGGSCNSGTVVCGEGQCDLSCTGSGSCFGTNVTCGPDSCVVTCGGGDSFQMQNLDCANSCGCNTVGC